MEDPKEVWPPPPSPTQRPADHVPRQRLSGDARFGWCALVFCGLATTCSLLYTLLIPLAEHGENWGTEQYADKMEGVFWTLQIASAALFICGLSCGIVGWYSWQGKVAIGIALVSPAWIVIWLLVMSIYPS